MTLDEMKLAVCEKLSELIVCQPCPRRDKYDPIATTKWKEYNDWQGHHERREIHWPTEGLQVCHEAEKLLGYLRFQYCRILEQIVGRRFGIKPSPQGMDDMVIFANADEKCEALCRVWWPERFV